MNSRIILALTIFVFTCFGCSSSKLDARRGADESTNSLRGLLDSIPLTCRVAAPAEVLLPEGGITISSRIQIFKGPYPINGRIIEINPSSVGISMLTPVSPDALPIHDISLRVLTPGAKKISIQVQDAEKPESQASCSIEILARSDASTAARAFIFADEPNVPTGASSLISWYTVNSDPNNRLCRLEINGQVVATSVDPSGVFTTSPLSESSNIFKIDCQGADPATTSVSVLAPPAGTNLPSVSFGLSSPSNGNAIIRNRVTVTPGEPVKLHWTSDADRCGVIKNTSDVLSDIATGAPIAAPTGEYIIAGFVEPAIYKLICAKRSGDQVLFMVEALVVTFSELSVSISASPTVVSYDGISTLSFAVSGSSSSSQCKLTKAAPGTEANDENTAPLAVPPFGVTANFSSGAITADTRFTASCTDGERSSSAFVDVELDAQWYQANGQNCPVFCVAMGKENVADPQGHRCTSGELIPASAIGIIDYNGCWPNCNAHGAPNGVSVGGRCYGTGQKRDNDGTDNTRGCFCG